MDDLILDHEIVDDVLDGFCDALGADTIRYRNHVYRGLNYQRKLLTTNAIPDEVAVAWALHDMGLWTSGWDYIPPSMKHLAELAPRYGLRQVDRALHMVEQHHKVRRCQDEWVETFRIADRIDVARGHLRSGLTRTDIRSVVHAFPYNGFHGLLVRNGARWAATHPLRPLPMLRW